MKIPSRSSVVFVFALLPIVALVGCGTISSIFQGKKPDYQKAGKLQPLEVPPDLTQPSADDRYGVPDVKSPPGTATLSTYNKEKGNQATGSTAAVQPGLLPSGDKAQVERAGLQRWLLVKAPAEQVWPVVRQYWQDAGYQIKTENATTGVMETEWTEGRQKMPESGIRGILQRALGTNYGTSYRDKFHTRIERTPDGNTEVYISHRRMEEMLEGGSREGTRWEPRPADPELEAENLSKLLVRFGVDEEKSKTLVAQDTPSRARLNANADGGGQLVVADPFDRAWRRVGLALDRVGFTVVDRDRSQGTYFVRYIDPQDDGSKDDKGFLSKLMFWKSDSKGSDGKVQYRIHVTESGGESTIIVENSAGVVEKSPTSSKILGLLFDQLK